MKYRKKPLIIEAMQFTDENKNQVFSWAQSYQMNISHGFGKNDVPELIIPTLEGEMRASLGDYIIKGIQGEFYPCKPDIFEQTYKKVE